MPRLLLLRHGHSMWNRDEIKPEKSWKYTGVVDVPLSEKGVLEALDAGKLVKNVDLNVAFASMLIRATTTALIALASHDSQQLPLLVPDRPNSEPRGLRVHKKNMRPEAFARVIPVYASHELNERSFGTLQGVHEDQQKQEYAEEDLLSWRCDFHARFPEGESALDVSQRVIGFFNKHVQRHLDQGKNVLMVVHGFVIRCLIKYLTGMTDKEWYEDMLLESSSDKKIRDKSRLATKNAVPIVFHYDVESQTYTRVGNMSSLPPSKSNL